MVVHSYEMAHDDDDYAYVLVRAKNQKNVINKGLKNPKNRCECKKSRDVI